MFWFVFFFFTCIPSNHDGKMCVLNICSDGIKFLIVSTAIKFFSVLTTSDEFFLTMRYKRSIVIWIWRRMFNARISYSFRFKIRRIKMRQKYVLIVFLLMFIDLLITEIQFYFGFLCYAVVEMFKYGNIEGGRSMLRYFE